MKLLTNTIVASVLTFLIFNANKTTRQCEQIAEEKIHYYKAYVDKKCINKNCLYVITNKAFLF